MKLMKRPWCMEKCGSRYVWHYAKDGDADRNSGMLCGIKLAGMPFVAQELDEGDERCRACEKVRAEPLFYIQDSRTYTGNSVVWWMPGGEGYTSKIDLAGRFTASEARARTQRDTDWLWPVEVVDKVWGHHVDIQDLEFRDALRVDGTLVDTPK